MIASPPSATASGTVRETDTLVRPATPGDAAACAELIHLPMGRVADFLFGFDDPALARRVLERLFAERANRFSHEFANVAQIEGQVAGLLLGYPEHAMQPMQLSMFQQLSAIYDGGQMLRFLCRTLPLAQLTEAEAGEFCIFSLAVRPQFQGRGIGTRLLHHAETRARLAGLAICSLGVEVGNDGARRLYERLGYQVAATVRVPHLEARIGYPGFHRMTKQLAEF